MEQSSRKVNALTIFSDDFGGEAKSLYAFFYANHDGKTGDKGVFQTGRYGMGGWVCPRRASHEAFFCFTFTVILGWVGGKGQAEARWLLTEMAGVSDELALCFFRNGKNQGGVSSGIWDGAAGFSFFPFFFFFSWVKDLERVPLHFRKDTINLLPWDGDLSLLSTLLLFLVRALTSFFQFSLPVFCSIWQLGQNKLISW